MFISAMERADGGIMRKDTMNDIVAKEFSDALARCHQQGIDPGTVRTGLLTIAIANFVNGIGLQNTISLFGALPEHIRSGMFDRFIDPNRERAAATAAPPPVAPAPVASRPEPVAPAPSRRRLV
tara:strand:+ start:1227 stop:1598 length:372 start_codon:yes stop_codon:yes gene_type:complete